MKKTSIIYVFLLATACGGVETKVTTIAAVDETAAQPEEVKPTAPPPARPLTPEERFRLGFTNPGGMWMPSQMTLPQHRENFEKMGVAIPAEKLSDPLTHPLGAIVFLGGCSASFVSPDGLVVTNHHCVQGALRHNSTPEKNLVEDGFLAQNRSEEVSAGPANRVLVAQAFKDVTGEMRDGLEKIRNPIMRKKEKDKRYKSLLAACEKDRPELRCTLSSFFNGNHYVMIEYLQIRDVRLVYVPKRSVGNYGGEIDNWAWPRHTGDFSFYRAYVGPDGKPADYSTDNVPFKPKHHLKVSTEGVRRGDFVMIAGYPGHTERAATAAAIHHDVNWYYPYAIEYAKQRYKVVENLLASPKPDKAAKIKIGVAKQWVQNGLERNQGVLAGLTRGDLLVRKDKLDAQIKAWAAEKGRESFNADIEKLEAIEAKKRQTTRADYDRRSAYRSSRLLRTAFELVRMAEERTKKDANRKPGYQERDLRLRVARQKGFARAYDQTLDHAFFRLALIRAAELPEKERPWLRRLLGLKKKVKVGPSAIDEALTKMYAETKLTDDAVRIEMLKNGTKAKLKKLKDPFIKAAYAVWPQVKAEEKKEDARKGEMLLVKPAYAHAMREVLGGFLAPDANATARITYGTVRSFTPQLTDEPNWPFTTAKQILKKDKGEKPFDAPKALIEAVKARQYGPYARPELGDELPVDFLSDLDITGGNSGSATLNHKGELVGLAFDGTIAGVASDVVFNATSSRTISADVRYMLWVMDKLDGADHLLEEMGVTPAL